MVGIFEIEPEGAGTRDTASARHWDEAAMRGLTATPFAPLTH